MKISKAGLKCDVLMIVDESTASGIVCNVDPSEGSKVTSDTTIRLYVSKGPSEEKVVVPDVLNKSLDAARSTITAAGLSVSDNIARESSDKPKDTVISMDPLPGNEVNKNSAVKLTLSSGVKREKKYEVVVDLPANVNHDVTVTTYINGVLDSTKKVNPSLYGTYTFNVKGNEGKVNVSVNLDGAQYRVYEVNFDASSNNVKRVKSFSYSDPAKSKSKSRDESDEYDD